jgi:hypothetical protein
VGAVGGGGVVYMGSSRLKQGNRAKLLDLLTHSPFKMFNGVKGNLGCAWWRQFVHTAQSQPDDYPKGEGEVGVHPGCLGGCQ